MAYRTLDASLIEKTCSKLHVRISERFPDASLVEVANEVAALAADIGERSEALGRPIYWLRLLIALVVIAAGLIFIFVGTFLPLNINDKQDAFSLVQGVESSINTIVFAGIGFVTLISIELRAKRQRALNGLHALRSIIHIIDMHQLTKDPSALLADFKPTKNSPKRTMTPAQLVRYLDYCSEMLSLCGKLAALYAQAVNDAVVVEAVNDIEELSTNLSRKIWQKITLIDAKQPFPQH